MPDWLASMPLTGSGDEPMSANSPEPWGPSQRARDPRSWAIAFFAFAIGVLVTVCQRSSFGASALEIVVVTAIALVLALLSIPRWSDTRHGPVQGALAIAIPAVLCVAAAAVVALIR